MTSDPSVLANRLPPGSAGNAAQTFRRWQSRTFWGLMMGYAGFYLCRPNLSAAAGPMSAEGFDTMAFGMVASLGTLCYAAGKLFAGPVVEALGGRRVFLWALYGSAAATAAAGLSESVALLALFWALGRWLQSFGWQGLVHIVPRWWPRRDHGTVMGAFSTSYQWGGVFGPLAVGGLASAGLHWRSFFTIPALLLVGVGLLASRWITEQPQDRQLSRLQDPEETDGDGPVGEEAPMALRRRLAVLLSRSAYLLTLGTSFALTLLRECFQVWMPKYFLDLGERVDLAVFKSAIFPLVGIVGTLSAGWLSDRVFGGRRGPVMAAFLVGLVASLSALAFLPEVAGRFEGVSPSTVAFVLVGLSGFFLLGPYSMVGGGVLALDFGGRRTAATAAGLLDAVGYLGAALAGVGVARVVSTFGWDMAFFILAVVAAGSLLLTLPLWRRHHEPAGSDPSEESGP